jgi:K+-sensing histidine kinase KdpD
MCNSQEEWLEQAAPEKRARLFKLLILGYAPGVGKTHKTLSEPIRRQSRGEDID